MNLNNIKIGMKVKLLGKHAFGCEYDNIEDWYEDCKAWEEVQKIKKQGYGIVSEIDEDGDVLVADNISDDGWFFLPSDLKPYDKEFFEESQENKSPKEWLSTPEAIFVVRNSEEKYIVLGNNTAISVDSGRMWDDDLVNSYTDNLRYYDDCPFNDIMKIEYKGNVVWERKEYVTLTDAIKTGKKIKYKDWNDFVSPTQALILISNDVHLINLFTEKAWEVDE